MKSEREKNRFERKENFKKVLLSFPRRPSRKPSDLVLGTLDSLEAFFNVGGSTKVRTWS